MFETVLAVTCRYYQKPEFGMSVMWCLRSVPNESVGPTATRLFRGERRVNFED
jgi:hypothetical protein